MENDQDKLVECLEEGDAIDALGPYSATALHWAAMLGREMMAMMLLAHGADPSRTDHMGRTPAQVARMHENNRIALVLKSQQEGRERQR